MHRRKIKPTHAERTIFGDGSGASLMNVADEPMVGKVGALSCWEHSQPLLQYHTYSQGEQINVAACPPILLCIVPTAECAVVAVSGGYFFSPLVHFFP